MKNDDKVLIGSLVGVACVFVFLAIKQNEQGTSLLVQAGKDVYYKSNNI